LSCLSWGRDYFIILLGRQYQIKRAIKNHDSASFNQYVDVDRIVDSLMEEASKSVEEEMGEDNPFGALGMSLVNAMAPSLKESMKQSINKSIEDISEGEGESSNKIEIKEIKKEGKAAEAILTNGNNEEIQLSMVRTGRRWKVVGISFDDFKKLNLKTDEDNKDQEEKKQAETQFIVRAIGEEVSTKTFKLKVNSATEGETIVSKYGTPQPATDGAKFVIVNMDVTNLTDEKFMFSPDKSISLVDDNGKKFETYDDTIGNIDDYLNVQDLSPSIVKKGVLVYEIPQDTSNYELFVENEGTEEIYQIRLSGDSQE